MGSWDVSVGKGKLVGRVRDPLSVGNKEILNKVKINGYG